MKDVDSAETGGVGAAEGEMKFEQIHVYPRARARARLVHANRRGPLTAGTKSLTAGRRASPRALTHKS